jgi:hypothetical protein
MVKLQLRLPDDVHQEAKRRARRQEISLNQFLVASISNELVRQETMSFFAPIADRFDEDKFRRALAQIPDTPPVEIDRRR